MTLSQNGRELPVLYSFRRCPYAIRARMALRVAGIACELREVLLRDKPPEMLALSKKATVPILHLSDDRVIDESLDVMHWALAHHDPLDWLDAPASQSWVTLFDNTFKHHLDRYKYASRYKASAAWQHRENGAQFLAELDRLLRPTGALSGSVLGVMDYASLPFVRQFRIADPDWFDAQPWPHLHCWLQDFLGEEKVSEIFQALDNQLTEKKTPTIGTGVPWST